MFEAIRKRATGGWPPAVSSTVFLAALAAFPAGYAAGQEPAARDLTVEQTAVFDAAAPAPAERLDVVAWVDHADSTYAIGEKVRLFVKANKDAYLTVLNVGASGRTTVLFPNEHQSETRVRANQVVEIPSRKSKASISVRGPTGGELIKVIASTKPTPLFAAVKKAGAGPFTTLDVDARSMARDLQVTMDKETDQEWDTFNQVITTVASRPAAAAPLAPTGSAWPAPPLGLRIATDKPVYRMGEPVSIYAAADTPCYLTLVNVGSSRRVRVLLPNAAQPQNHLLPAGRTVVFPAAASKLRVSPIGPPGMETVVAVCSTDNQPVFPFGLSYGQNGFASLDDGRASVARDLAVVAAAPAPNRQVGQAAVGFVVAQ